MKDCCIYKGGIYFKEGPFMTSVDRIPCDVCEFGDKGKCNKPKDFELSCGNFGYIKKKGINTTIYIVFYKVDGDTPRVESMHTTVDSAIDRVGIIKREGVLTHSGFKIMRGKFINESLDIGDLEEIEGI